MLIVPLCSMRLMNLKIAITAITSNTPITADTRINTNWFSIAFSKGSRYNSIITARRPDRLERMINDLEEELR